MRTVPARGAGEAGRIICVERRGAGGGQGFERGDRVLLVVPGAGDQSEDRSQTIGEKREDDFGESSARNIVAQKISEVRAMVRSADRRHRSDQLRRGRSHPALVETAVTMS